jgi:formylglycine-generating enzyme required for sulfatase activity
MGSNKEDDPEAYSDEMVEDKAHWVSTVDHDYWMARYPVTVAQYAVFVDKDAYTDRRWWSETGLAWRQGEWDSALRQEDFSSREVFENYKVWLASRGVEKRHQPMWWQDQLTYPNRPVMGVCWFEAQAYCSWLDARVRTLDGLDWIEQGYRIRLPTEAEWEKAARAGDLRRYPRGNDKLSEHRANVQGKIGRASSVGMYPEGANPLGLHDLSGNVWEWTRSVYHPYHYDPTKAETAALQPGNLLVFRGGSWINNARDARCAARFRYVPDYYDNYLGFRVVLSLATDG